MACHNNVKIYNAFFRKNCIFYLPPFQSTMILLSRFYTARDGTTINYAKKNRYFYYYTYFFIRNTWQDKKASQNTYFMCFHLLYIWTPRWNVRSNTYDFCPQLCRNRLEDVTNLSNTILLPIVMQVHEFYGKLEKLKKKKLWITTNKKVTKGYVL